jgi:hypothetical protein
MKQPVIEIELNENGLGSVKIDGQELSGATGRTVVHIDAVAGKTPQVTLDMWAHNLKIKLPATVIAEIREAYTIDDETENRIVERVLAALTKGGRR